MFQTRSDEEGATLEPLALEILTRIAGETSLRYALHLITTADLVRVVSTSSGSAVSRCEPFAVVTLTHPLQLSPTLRCLL